MRGSQPLGQESCRVASCPSPALLRPRCWSPRPLPRPLSPFVMEALLGETGHCRCCCRRAGHQSPRPSRPSPAAGGPDGFPPGTFVPEFFHHLALPTLRNNGLLTSGKKAVEPFFLVGCHSRSPSLQNWNLSGSGPGPCPLAQVTAMALPSHPVLRAPGQLVRGTVAPAVACAPALNRMCLLMACMPRTKDPCLRRWKDLVPWSHSRP